MKRKQMAAVAMVGVLLGAGSLLAATGGASASVTAKAPVPGCSAASDDAWWPAWTHLRPANIDLKTVAGVYMWHDGLGWHVRTTHRTVAHKTLSGRIQTKTGRFSDVKPVRLEGSDSVHVSDNHRVINFRFDNHGAIDGLDFRSHCATWIEFGFVSDGSVLAVNKVSIGHNGAHPTIDPFSIFRR